MSRRAVVETVGGLLLLAADSQAARAGEFPIASSLAPVSATGGPAVGGDALARRPSSLSEWLVAEALALSADSG